MNKDQFDQFLDNPDMELTDATTRDMAALLRTLETDEAPEADQVYWNNFNARLQTRLDEGKRKPWFLRGPVWMGTLATAAIVAAILLPDFKTTNLESFTLASLSDADLNLISEVYVPLDEEDVAIDLADADLDLLLDSVGGDEWDAEGFLDVDPEQLESIWKEG